MAEEKKTRTINIGITPTSFTSIFKRFKGERHDYEFSGLSDLRLLLSNEKAKILYIVKNNKPNSIYHLAKLLKRDFKSVREDVKVLEKFGFIALQKDAKGNRRRLKPILLLNSLKVVFDI